eukprot:TRINITY_DN23620_c0_g1_i1.p1 TRINITY_DN23620_c0_g1~~TRINITY_DN23620_c0_g1_i1.p1  ORF type:complete len:696 (+),score=164.52 TRINITY_DN23620_c0_g1_i1:195-2282(+)
MSGGRNEPPTTTLRKTAPQEHGLPCHIIWGATLITAVLMAIANFFTIICISTFVKRKLGYVQDVVNDHGVGWGIFALIVIDVFFGFACMGLIFSVAPGAGGSGAPENKGWLNGSVLKGFFSLKVLFIRATAVCLGNASSYPVGREGPSVTMGSFIAYFVTRALALPHVSKSVEMDAAGDLPVDVIDEERLAFAQRVVGSVGGACAMAMIFNAPIGGILYMFEEINVTSWPIELTFRAFVGTMVCCMVSYFLLGLCSLSIQEFVIYEWQPQEMVWSFVDVPIFVVIAMFLGPFSALHTRCALAVAGVRQRFHNNLSSWQPYAKVGEAVAYAGFCALVFGLSGLLAYCDTEYLDQPLLATGYVRYNCDAGSYNPVASLMLTSTEAALKRLFSRENSGSLSPTNSLISLCTYTTLNVLLTGVPVPAGNFTGTMLIGALTGRFMGSLARVYIPDGLAESGVYAMVGSAAMLAGFKQISMSVVVFISVAGQDLSLTTPLMMSVAISLCLNNLCLRRGFDEEQILRKAIPFIPPEAPHSLARVRAKDLCDLLPTKAVLPPAAPVAMVQRALEEGEVSHFPIVRGGTTCVGFTTRARLEQAMEARANRPGSPSSSANLALLRVADPVPYKILENAITRDFYLLFSKGGAEVVCVASECGEFRGMITRKNMVKTVREHEEAEDNEDDDSEDGMDTEDGALESL